MKYFTLGIFSGLILYILILNVGQLYGSEKNLSRIPSPTVVITNTPTSLPEKKPGIPIKFIIPKLNINSDVEQVGYITPGKMDVPKNFIDVAWFSLGVRPGEKGNAVIDGHFDTYSGAPAVFYYLVNLNVGDEINIIDDKGEELKFLVTGNNIYPYDQFPLTSVFGNTNERILNLITCEGIWDRVAHNYSNRLLITATLTN